MLLAVGAEKEDVLGQLLKRFLLEGVGKKSVWVGEEMKKEESEWEKRALSK